MWPSHLANQRSKLLQRKTLYKYVLLLLLAYKNERVKHVSTLYNVIREDEVDQ